MHEIAICQSLLRQVLEVASSHDTRPVVRILLRIGPLSGVEPDLLLTAFPLVAAGTPCEGAVIEVERTPVRVLCPACGSMSDVRPNRLVCGTCGAWRVTVVGGDEMLLSGIELPAAKSLDSEARTYV